MGLFVPKSPVDAKTVTLCFWASMRGWRSFEMVALAPPLNVASPAPRLILITSARWWSTTY